MSTDKQLNRSLSPLMLWGLGVGYVISGMYFGWNLGLAEGGTLGLGIATVFITLMYICFTLSYTELACAIPGAGGAFDYAQKGLGKQWGFIAGIAQIIEFVFAPPAIAAAIGAYLHIFLPGIPVTVIAVGAYVVFTALNISGVKAAARFELFVTLFAVVELLIFAGLTLPHFEFANLQKNAFPHGMTGIFAAVPFAIWFFLGIEGLANVAEETIDPAKSIKKGFGSAIFTLVVLCALVFVSAVGVDGWESIVYSAPGSAPSDSPLPLALGIIAGSDNLFYHLLVTIGLFGLVASFHGILLAAGRATFEFGRVGYAPRLLGRVHPLTKTPVSALIANMLLGIIALLTGKTAQIITIACFGALTLYIISMVALLALRKKFPEGAQEGQHSGVPATFERPFKVPFYPLLPLTALIIAVVAMVSMAVFNVNLFLIYSALVGISFAVFRIFGKQVRG